jgi:hypothetical protein
MNTPEYARQWLSSEAANWVRPVTVPDNVERVDEHTPCFKCGVRAGLPCRHRRMAA